MAARPTSATRCARAPSLQPNFALRDTGDDGNEERKYFRAEVHLREGGQDYDVMGWVREAVIDDILDQYEKHMHYLHLVR